MQFRDLQRQYEVLKSKIDKSIQNVLNEANFIGGEQVYQLEKRTKYVGVKHCISCANGTDALQLALMAWGIGDGDADTSDFTFFASAGCASMGATPVLVDIDERTFNIDPNDLEAKIRATLKKVN